MATTESSSVDLWISLVIGIALTGFGAFLVIVSDDVGGTGALVLGYALAGVGSIMSFIGAVGFGVLLALRAHNTRAGG